MTEDFDVKLVEDVKSYTPDPRYKKNSWLGDYRTAYDEFLKDQNSRRAQLGTFVAAGFFKSEVVVMDENINNDTGDSHGP